MSTFKIPESFVGLKVVSTGTFVCGNWPVLRFPGGGEIAVEPSVLQEFDAVWPELPEPPDGAIWVHEVVVDGGRVKRVAWQRDDDRAAVNDCANWFPTLGSVAQTWATLRELPGKWTELVPATEDGAANG